MMLDMLAAIARKDYEDRRRRQSEGISKAKAEGKYRGRVADAQKHELIRTLRLVNGKSLRETARLAGVSKIITPATFPVRRAVRGFIYRPLSSTTSRLARER